MKRLCVPVGGEIDQFGLGDGVISQFVDLARGEVFGVDGRARGRGVHSDLATSSFMISLVPP